jgi:hypothetical protein
VLIDVNGALQPRPVMQGRLCPGSGLLQWRLPVLQHEVDDRQRNQREGEEDDE